MGAHMMHGVLAIANTTVPYLGLCIGTLRYIWNTVEEVNHSIGQLTVLADCAAQLLHTLYVAERRRQVSTSYAGTAARNFHILLEEILTFARTEAKCGFLKSLLIKEDRINAINEYHRRLITGANSLQIAALFNFSDWRARNEKAREHDQKQLLERLAELEAKQSELYSAFNAHQKDIVAILTSLQRKVNQLAVGDKERKFLQSSLTYLSASSGKHPRLESWTITSYEVEFGQQIGLGGFGEVFKGTWNKAPVALKVLKTGEGIYPSAAAMQHEISIWSTVRHTNVLQFLGANVLDDRPFIVMPYMKNGNARDYVLAHADSNRTSMLCQISLGLIYLHSRNVIHGDLKAMNVLIDDCGNAVLCDFGLSRIKSDVTARTPNTSKAVSPGSLYWMAPELFCGEDLSKESDVYAFGMILFELYTNQIPLGNIPSDVFIQQVVSRNIRPKRPRPTATPGLGLSDDLWNLAENCWIGDPEKRPSANAVCDTLTGILNHNADDNSPQRTPSHGKGAEFVSLDSPSIRARPVDPGPHAATTGLVRVPSRVPKIQPSVQHDAYFNLGDGLVLSFKLYDRRVPKTAAAFRKHVELKGIFTSPVFKGRTLVPCFGNTLWQPEAAMEYFSDELERNALAGRDSTLGYLCVQVGKMDSTAGKVYGHLQIVAATGRDKPWPNTPGSLRLLVFGEVCSGLDYIKMLLQSPGTKHKITDCGLVGRSISGSTKKS